MKLKNTSPRRMAAYNIGGTPIVFAPGEAKDIEIADEEYVARLIAAGFEADEAETKVEVEAEPKPKAKAKANTKQDKTETKPAN